MFAVKMMFGIDLFKRFRSARITRKWKTLPGLKADLTDSGLIASGDIPARTASS